MKPYKIYIMQYARRDATTSDVLLGDMHQAPYPMGYFMWALTNGEHTVVVDMGFTEEVCRQREGREWVFDPAGRMEAIGIDPGKVEHVIITHMHYDHVGNYALFPKATFYVQEDEMAFWTGPYSRYEAMNVAINVDDVAALVAFNYAGRIVFCRGTREIVPGIRVHRVSGHTKGMQFVEVQLAGGAAVLASDASHMYRNFQEYTPFPLLHDVPGMLDGFEQMRLIAAKEEMILPGHDAEVMNRYPLVTDGVALME